MYDEAQMFQMFLDYQRGYVLAIIAGLSEDDLHRVVFPSGWTCLQLVAHLTSAEQYWFQIIAAGERDFPAAADESTEWQIGREAAPGVIIANYRAACEESNRILSAGSLDAAPVRIDPRWVEWEPLRDVANMRWIALHLIEETARHAGHLDTARELLDGATGLGPH